MPTAPTASELLDRDYLSVRSRILDIAAALDRIDRGSGAGVVPADARIIALRSGIASLIDDEPDRARRVQMVFSDEFDPAWRGR